jgi:hypothetical protein
LKVLAMRRLAALVLVLPLLAGCPDDPTKSDDLGWLDQVGAGKVVVDATAKDGWTYFSFAAGKVVPAPANPEASLDWDLAFQRYNMKTNGGTSGKGQGAVADLGELKMEETDVVKSPAWAADAVVEDARTGEKRSMNATLGGWYAYHFGRHQLVSLYRLYAVRAADGRVATFKIYDYYDAAGTAGHFTILFRFPMPLEGQQTDGDPTPGTNCALVPGEAPPADTVDEVDGVVSGETNLDVRGGETFFSFEAGGAVAIDGDPKASAA